MTNKHARKLTEVNIAYFKVNHKVAKQCERFLESKQIEQIKAWDKKKDYPRGRP